MPITPDEMNRVIYSKYLIERAKAHQAQGSELGSAQAILTAHDGAEMLMRVVYDHLKIDPPFQFMKFWELLDKHRHVEPPFKAAMNGLNNQRNEFKHGGRLPHSKNVAALLPQVVAFCEEIAHLYLAIDYKGASLAALIENVEAKKHLEAAEIAHASSDTQEAFKSLRLAFVELLGTIRKNAGNLPSRIAWRPPRIRSGRSELDNQIESFVRSLGFESIVQQLNYVSETLGMVILGIDVTLLRQFDRKAPTLFRTGLTKKENHFTWPTPVEKLTNDDFDFCYSFVIDVGLRQI
jgi:hypothetical protein